jgi:pimeloyl-ACP methyl ester carboxylesterase
MCLVIYGALRLVAYIAGGQIRLLEIPIILWFTITWRMAWTLWCRTVGRWGERWVRWARMGWRRGLRPPRVIALIPLGRALCTAFVFFPLFLSMVVTHRFKIADNQNPLNTFQMPYESILIPTPDGLLLEGWFVPQDDADRTIVICHGAGANKGNFIWFLGPLANHGYNVAFFDFRAHGGSDGRRTTYGLQEKTDVKAVVEWLKRERPAQAREIVGLGSSQGAMALALAAAEESRIDAIILDSPFVSPAELSLCHARKVPVVGPAMVRLILAEMSLWTQTDFFAASAEEAVASVGLRPVMVIHGSGDFMMPPSHARRLYDAARGPRDIWFGPGPHSNIVTEAPSEYAGRVFAFLDQQLGPVDRGSPIRRRSASRPSTVSAKRPAVHADAPL